MSGQINKSVWLVTYPKSGTTWFRSFLTALVSEKSIDINDLLPETLFFSLRSKFRELTHIPSELLDFAEIESYYQYFVRKMLESHTFQRPLFLQTHNAYRNGNFDFLNKSNTQGIIYIIRNPLAIVSSMSQYLNISIDQSIDILNDDNFVSNECNSIFLTEFLGSWSNHVLSWKNQSNFSVKFVRYEDLLTNPQSEFGNALRRVDLNYSFEFLNKAIKASDFEILNNQEKEKGFIEKPNSSKAFFRKGSISYWKEELNDIQQSRVIRKHKNVMKKFKYL